MVCVCAARDLKRSGIYRFGHARSGIQNLNLENDGLGDADWPPALKNSCRLSCVFLIQIVHNASILETLMSLAIRGEQVMQAKQGLTEMFTINGVTGRTSSCSKARRPLR